ncbi:hypothetical protein ACXM1Q_000195 [Streptococcus sp. 10F2]
MLDTLLKLTEILALGTASICALDLMIRRIRLKRRRKREAEIAVIEARAYKKAEQDLAEKQRLKVEQLAESRKRLDPWSAIQEERAYRKAANGNVIQLPYRP